MHLMSLEPIDHSAEFVLQRLYTLGSIYNFFIENNNITMVDVANMSLRYDNMSTQVSNLIHVCANI